MALRDDDNLDLRVKRRLRPWLWGARAALGWERFWPAVAPALGLLGLFLVGAWLGLFAHWPAWAHLLAMILLLGGALALGAWNLRRFRFADDAEARRRLERDSALPYRPISGLEEALASGNADPGARALWLQHRRRLWASLTRLSLGWPRAGLAARDPWGLRVGLALLLIVGFAAAGPDWDQRLYRSLTPQFAAAEPPIPPRVDLWVTPPSYTGLPPQLLASGEARDGAIQSALAPAEAETADATPDEAETATAEESAAGETTPSLTIAENSVILAQIAGSTSQPILHLDETAYPFEALGADGWRLQQTIPFGTHLALTLEGETIAEWALTVTPDQAPNVILASPPTQTDRGVLNLIYEAKDDYGVDSVGAIIRSTDPELAARSLDLPLALPSRGGRSVKTSVFNDLTAHPLAGTEVTIQLVARDATGQTGRNEPYTGILPERPFHHPVARAIISLRRMLIFNPDRAEQISAMLRALAEDRPSYNHDNVVTLSLTSTSARLRYDRDRAGAIEGVIGQLWDTALRVEEGELATALLRLRELQDRLQEALQNGTDEEELQRLMDELQKAMNEYIDALQEKLQRDLAEGRQLEPIDPEALALQKQDLQEMLDRAREMAESGARDAARNMLSQLQQLLENLEAAPLASEAQEGENEAAELMRRLQELTDRQQSLLDETFRRAQEAENGMPIPDLDGSAAAQEQLRRDLGEIMREFGDITGDIPRQLGNAERAMNDAVGALMGQLPGPASESQTQALQELMAGAESMMQTLAQQFGSRPGRGGLDQLLGQNPNGTARSLPGSGFLDTGDVKIPTEAELQRARQILEELRRRAEEQFRPRYERDYIEKLLERF